jgi:hypothetical protein
MLRKLLPSSSKIQGPRFRSSRYTRPWTLEDGSLCKLHNLCASCSVVFEKSRLIQGSRLFFVPSVEYFTLHQTYGEFVTAVQNRCHLCTLLWTQITRWEQGKSDHEACPVFIMMVEGSDNISEDSLCLAAMVAPQPGVAAKDLPWHEYDYLSDPHTIRLDLWPGRFSMGGRVYHAGNHGDRYNPHPSHGEPHTGSPAHMRLAKFWLSGCLEHHVHCRNSSTTFVPKRLISIDYPSVRLRLTNVEDTCLQYCALSHCWGGATDILNLTTENLESFLTNISLNDLPKSFRDAITVTNALGVNYLWIDCLCIVQNDSTDWTAEAAVMGKIYENAACTILAASASDSHQGCFFERDPLSYAPCRVAGSRNALLASDFRPALQDPPQEPLFKRAWTFQERLLSPRVIEFTKLGMNWRCIQGEASEIQPHGGGTFLRNDITTGSTTPPLFGEGARHDVLTMHLSRVVNSFARLQPNHSILSNIQTDLRDSHTFHRLWSIIVHEYSRCALTRSTDKLIALSGIARRVLDTNPEKKYVAGLWVDTVSITSDTFTHDLLWWVSGPKPRPTSYLAPTWSWASQTGHVNFFAVTETETIPLVQVLGITIDAHPLDITKTGVVRAGQLSVRGMVKSLHDLKSPQVCIRYDPIVGFALESNNRRLGGLFRDTLEPLRVTHLIPIQRAKRSSVMYKENFDMGYSDYRKPRILENSVFGLALEWREERFRRVGFFELDCEQEGSLADRLFQDCEVVDVLVY